MGIVEFFKTNNRSTKFSKDIKDYRLLSNKWELDTEYPATDGLAEYYDEHRNKGLYVVTADREIPCNDLYYWLGDLIVDKDYNIIDGISFN